MGGVIGHATEPAPMIALPAAWRNLESIGVSAVARSPARQ